MTSCIGQNAGRPQDDPVRNFIRNQQSGPLLSTYLLSDQQGPDLWFELSDVALLIDNEWFSLLHEPVVVDTAALDSSQLFLSRIQPKAGKPSRIKFILGRAALTTATGRQFLDVASPEVEIPIPFDIEFAPQQHAILQLIIDSGGSRPAPGVFDAKFSLMQNLFSVQNDLLFAACPEINTIYVLRTDSNHVVGALWIDGHPQFMKLSKEANTIIVLTTSPAALHTYELSSWQKVDYFHIPYILEPGQLSVSADFRTAYTYDRRDNFVYKINLASGILENRVQSGNTLNSMHYMRDQHLLAVASDIDQEVRLLNPDSLEAVTTLATGPDPIGLFSDDTSLYFAERSGNSLASYAFESGAQRKIQVGAAPEDVLVNQNDIYVTSAGAGLLQIIKKNPFMAKKVIPVKGRPGKMAVSTERRWLYIADQQDLAVKIVDLTAYRLKATIPFYASISALESLE